MLITHRDQQNTHSNYPITHIPLRTVFQHYSTINFAIVDVRNDHEFEFSSS
jgi:hypothetical protein